MLGQPQRSALPRFGQHGPALLHGLGGASINASGLVGQQQVAATGVTRQGFEGAQRSKAMALQLMLPERRALLARQRLLRACQPPAGLGTEDKIDPACRVLPQQRHLAMGVELAAGLAQGVAHGAQRAQVGRYQHPVERTRFGQLLQAEHVQRRAIVAQALLKFRFSDAVGIVDAVEIQPGVQQLRKRGATKAKLQYAQALPGRQLRQALGQGLFNAAQQVLLPRRPQHQAGQAGTTGFPRLQRVERLAAIQQCRQVAAHSAHRMDNLEVLGVALEQLLPDGLRRRALARVGQLPATVGAALQAAITLGVTQQGGQEIALGLRPLCHLL
ncbi:hypothetical protein D3C76_682840 [compost metagenome]